MTAILFGSISTIADTSELQRDAFNKAFAAHDLDWRWERDEYVSLLKGNGGAKRIAEYAQARGESVDADAVHRSKSQIFQESVGSAGIAPRPGVAATIREGRDSGLKVALVTTTSEDNITSLLAALEPDVRREDFDVIVDSDDVETPKPDKASYAFALDRLGEQPDACVAIEDNVGGVEAAKAAGVACAAFPNENTASHDFDEADERVDHLALDELQALIPAA